MTAELAARCLAVADLAQAGQAWIAAPGNAERVGAELPGLTRDLRRAGARARKLAQAATRNMCVGVFGPSQAGKSFLVSVLARPRGGRLVAQFDGDGARDFISEINPPGEGESTGLVTRFTMTRVACPAGHPVRLRLLSEADLVRILVNTFLMDGDQSEEPPTPAEIDRHLAQFAPRAGDAAGLSEDEVWEIRDYLEKGFSRSAYVAALKPIWDEAAALAPRLGPSDRAAFFALLWGRHEVFSALYAQLAAGLASLGHAREAFASLDALIPRTDSIIDVKTLAGLDHPRPGAPVALRTPDGRAVRLDKPLVTALTAELVIPMADQPWEMFAQTDLLDFPGARARFTNNIAKTFATAETPRKDTFLRGKVAYLFDRYVAEQELTSMLLCLPPSNMEVTDLPGLVEEWVRQTHGATPEERARATCILFFVFTKFDMHLADNATTGTDPVTRYQRRVEASLIDPFGKMSDAWPNNWAGRPFTNSFWLRNPNYPAEAFINYDAQMREVDLVPTKVARLAELRAGCLSAPGVQTHFADPGRAWDAAMTLNDGGIGYLVEALTPVCRPQIKATQVAGQLARVVEGVRQRLAPFHVSDDLEARLAAARAAADQVIAAVDHALAINKFGEMLEGLMVDPTRIADRVIRVPESVFIVQAAAAPAPAATLAAAAPTRIRPGGPRPGAAATAAPPPAAPAEAPRQRRLTREAFQAECALRVWLDTLHEWGERRDLYDHFGVPPGVAGALVAELAAAARRTGLEARLAAELAAWNFALRSEAQAGPVSVVAAERINRFVARLGVDEMAPDHRPRVDLPEGGARAVFAPRPVRFDAGDLPDLPEPVAEAWVTDWLFALYRLFEDNALGPDQATVNIAQNAALGRILAGLDAGGAA